MAWMRTYSHSHWGARLCASHSAKKAHPMLKAAVCPHFLWSPASQPGQTAGRLSLCLADALSPLCATESYSLTALGSLFFPMTYCSQSLCCLQDHLVFYPFLVTAHYPRGSPKLAGLQLSSLLSTPFSLVFQWHRIHRSFLHPCFFSNISS